MRGKLVTGNSFLCSHSKKEIPGNKVLPGGRQAFPETSELALILNSLQLYGRWARSLLCTRDELSNDHNDQQTYAAFCDFLPLRLDGGERRREVALLKTTIRLNIPLRDVRVKNGAEALVSELKVRQLLEEQFRNGFEAGQKALGEQLVEQRKQLLDLQNGLLRSLERSLPGVAADCEKSLVLLALESARRVAFGTPIDAALIEKTVLTAVAELKDTADYEVLLHPEDLSLLVQVQSGIVPPAESKRIRFSADPAISRGDCIVNTRHGSIAARREQIFEKLESAVLC